MKKLDFNTYILEEHLNDAYYTIRWSKYLKYEKYEILKKLPELAGLYVIFYLNQHKKLTPFFLGYSWVGSLRYDIKLLSDENAPVDKDVLEIVKDKECYYKYLTISNYNDLIDIYEYYKYFYRFIDFIQISENKDSGRFKNVFVKEYTEKY